LIVGAGDVGQLVARKLGQHPEYAIELVGFVDDDPRVARADVEVNLLGGVDGLVDLVEQHDVDRVIVAFSGKPDARTLALVRLLPLDDVVVDVVPRLFELIGPRATLHSIEGVPVVALPPTHVNRASLATKRVIDLTLASFAVVLTAPLFVYIAYRIKRDSPGPIFYRQTRLGYGMRPFTALKFRTMATGTDDREHRDYIRSTMSSDAELGPTGVYKLERTDAITRVGGWLRRSSLDELPQLINVLLGEMSLVGPRPCIPYEVEHFQPHHFERFLVPQGITGLWQVSARSSSTFGEALEMDVAYARGWSLGLDLRLLFRTPFALHRQRRATA
jgi:exopolysaccharide biosynthesis polyprenyl glycosylphosphotransferase